MAQVSEIRSQQGLLDPALDGLVPVPGIPDTVADFDTVGEWPRMLVLDEETEKRLVEYLRFEIAECWRERDLLAADWIQWQTDYWAKPEKKVRNFPFAKAANVVIPMTAIAVEDVYANLINTLFSVKPFYSIRPRTRSWVDAAPQVERWLQTEIEDVNSLDAYGFARDSLLEIVKLGTGIGKSGYERDVRKANIDLPDGSIQERWVDIKNGATLDYVPLANYLQRLHFNNPQTADWVGEEHNGYSWAQMKREALSGRIRKEALEEIKAYRHQSLTNSESSGAKVETARREMEHAEPGWNETFDTQEIWLSFDVDLDGVDEEIVVDFHYDSGTILSARYNWYSDLHRPYRIGVLMPVEGRWAGIGIGKQLEQFQPLITTIHRQRLDAGTLANMGQLAIKKTSGYGPGEPIFPGKMWFLDDVQDIKEFTLSNTQHFAQIQNEENAKAYADRRSTVNDLNTGVPNTRTPAPATSDMAKLAEGRKKFDMYLKNIKRWYGLLGTDILANFQQFGNKNRHWLEKEPEGKHVDMFLQLPSEHVRRGAVIELTVTDSITNKDVEQQKWQGLFALLTGNYNNILEKAMAVAQITGDPSVFLTMADMALRATNEATRRLLEVHNVPDIENFLLDLRQVQNAQSSEAPTRGNGGSPNSVGAPGMEQLLAAIGTGSGGRTTPSNGGA